MSALRAPPDTPSESSAMDPPGTREARLSRRCLWWLPAAPFAGFALAGRVLDLGTEGAWVLWKAAVLGGLLMAPFALGVWFGYQSVRKGCRGGWVGLFANLGLAILAIGMPLAETLFG
jgi:hypothetical protein